MFDVFIVDVLPSRLNLRSGHHSALAEEALKLFGALYDVERKAREVSAEQRRRMRQLQSQPIADKLREWLLLRKRPAKSSCSARFG